MECGLHWIGCIGLVVLRVALDWLYAKLDCVEYEMWCRSGKYNGRLEKQNCAKDFLTSVRGTGRNLIHWICYSAYVATCLVKIFY